MDSKIRAYSSWLSRTCNPSDDEKLLRPCVHMDPFTLGESNFLMDVIRAMNHWLKVPQKQLDLVILVAQMMYAKDTIFDDMIDNTEIRNKMAAAHLVYGIANTVSSIAYVMLSTIEKILFEFKNPIEAIKIHLEQSLDCLRGQFTEVEWLATGQVPTEEEYRRNIHLKTCAPVLNGILLLQHFSEDKTDYTEYGRLLGTFFQLHNDYINLCSKKYHETKGFCEDITEGKFSVPIIHAIRTRPNDKRVLNILKQKTNDKQVKEFCLSLLEEFGSLEYAKKSVLRAKDDIIKATKALGGNREIVRVIESHYSNW